jgi:nucleoporin NUP2
MSGKRTAEEQIDSYNVHLFENGYDDDDEPQQQARASSEVLAKRKILKPRSRLAGRTTATTAPQPASNFGFNFQPIAATSKTTTTDDNSKPNPFAGFGGANTTTSGDNNNGNHEEKPKANPFAIFGSQNNTNATSSITTSKPAFSFGQPSSSLVSASSDTSSSSKKSDKPSKIKALNDSLYDKLSQQRSVDPVSNFTPLLRKYIDYYEQIENDTIVEDAPEEPKQIEQHKGGNDDEEEKEEKAQKLLPSSEPINSFGGSKPSFSFGQTTATSNSSSFPSFSFGSKTNDTPKEQEPVPQEKGSSAEVIDVDDDSDSDDEIKVEGPTFTLAKPPTSTDSVFKLSKDVTTSGSTNATGPSFTFSGGDKKFDNPFKLTKPVIGETKEKENAEQDKPPAATSSFTWNKTDSDKTASNANKQEEVSKPQTSGFSFQTNQATTESHNAPSSAFNFNFKPTPQPSNGDSTTESKPKFDLNFGSSASTNASDKPAFSFGSSSTGTSNTAAPSFNFGGNSTAANPTSTFGGASSFNFNFSKPSATTPPAEGSNSGDKGNDNIVEEEEADVKFKPVAKLQDEKVNETTGEEEEDLVYTKRSKIQKFDKETKSYESKGLGELRILVNNSTKKARILVRADGSNRVILNIPILADFKYEKIGNKGNLVKIPAVEAGKIETYLATVKTAEDGTNLLNSLDKAKESL